ncbi:MAG: SpoIIE family protein phosphatase [Acidobacteria bacterium]|nr:SpoIIE family protein phosphatase [Acidobacteriota bacterium]
MARLSDKQLRVIVSILAIVACIYQYRFFRESYSKVFQRSQSARSPFFLQRTAPVVAFLPPESREAGLAEGDRVIAINGVPFTGMRVLGVAMAHAKAGDSVRVTFQPGGGGPERTATILLRAPPGMRNPWVGLFLHFIMPAFSFALGFWVVFVRPHDGRAWILLAVMVSFTSIFSRQVDIHEWSDVDRPVGLLIRVFMGRSWPFWLLMLALHFPEKLWHWRWINTLAWLVGFPLVLQAAVDLAFEAARMESFDVAASIGPIAQLFHTIDFLPMVAIGIYFATLGVQWGIARTPDAKRRAGLLNVGSHLSMTPTFILVLRSIFTGSEMFGDGPGGFNIVALLMHAIFPITLAYIVVVHRAMDVRVVLRTGLQYALARRGLVVIEFLVLSAAIAYAVLAVDPSETPTERFVQILPAIVVVVALMPLSKRLREWVDRRFFREAYNAEQILSELSEEVRSIPETSSLLETVGQRISECLHVPQIAVLLRSDGMFRPAYAMGFGDTPDASFAENSPLVARLQQPVSVYVDDPDSWVHHDWQDGYERDSLLRLAPRLLLPLSAKAGMLGFLSLGPKLSEEPYSPSDMRLLKSVAVQTGLAIENSKLTEAMAREMAEREQLNKEMAIARDVQRRLFPQKFPSVQGVTYAGGCIPAQSVGGDYYDFLELKEGLFAFAVGDVSGKGMPAALLMSALQASVRGQALNGIIDLAVFSANVNQLLYDMSPRSHFATLFYAIFEPASRRLLYANCGHNPPILLRSSGGTLALNPTGPGVGLSMRSTYRHAETTLQAGDILLAFTDGITEAMNPQNEEFGEVRLQDALSEARTLAPEAILQHIVTTVEQFSAGAPQHDDMTAVVFKVNEI